ncbi:hypothetical protein HAX54_037558 [Datura stramonium]|uniref:MADS-box domain-containing protein n=1 Tax=Datura stramonium TaxID=4076 RepID=A0ABS8SHC5_DATST|nr:hypothetical protein [Datura stramonium]
MEKRIMKGRKKIEMKLIESENARTVSFSKRKKNLFKKADEFSTLTGADVGVILFSPSGKPYSYGSTSIEKITDKFLELKLDDSQRDQADVGKSNVFEAYDDLCKELDALNKKEKERIQRYEVMHPGSEVPPDKHRLEQLMSIKLRLDKVEKEAKSGGQAKLFEFDLNVVPEPDEEESF